MYDHRLTPVSLHSPQRQRAVCIQMEGDVAMACPDDFLGINVAVRPGFKPTNWTVVDREDEPEMLQCIRDMKTANDEHVGDLVNACKVVITLSGK